MKYKFTGNDLIYDLDYQKPGRYACPVCSANSKRNNPKDIEVYKDSEIIYCHKCKESYYPYKPFSKEKDYKVPEWKNITKLTDKAVKYWNGRMISQETLKLCQVYSDVQWMPQFEKEVEVICFPFFRGDKLVNIKYRGPEKSFKLVSGAELIWFNFNVISDSEELIIVEGEPDAMTWIENGYFNVISVPNGANAKNMEYLDNSIKMFDSVKKIYLATDNDTAGIELRNELARRIGYDKSYIVNLKECKDSNEYFKKYGGIEFKKLLEDSKPFPIKGIVRVESLTNEIIDLYENGIQKGKEILNDEIDKFCTWELGRLAIITGVPGSGKSEFLDYLIARLNLLYGWKAAFFTPENYPLKFHYAKLHEKYSGKKFKKETDDGQFWGVFEHINNNFYYIMNEEDMTVYTIMESANLLVKQKGVKIVVIDPYNKLDHAQKSNETETQYISKFLDTLTSFSKFNNVLVFLVAHPTKMMKGEVPSLYNISGSAHFYNKTDYGIVVDRTRNENNIMQNEVRVYWQKIKFKHLGEQGISELKYNYNNGRFETGTVDKWDNNNWIYTPQINNDDITQVREVPF